MSNTIKEIVFLKTKWLHSKEIAGILVLILATLPALLLFAGPSYVNCAAAVGIVGFAWATIAGIAAKEGKTILEMTADSLQVLAEKEQDAERIHQDAVLGLSKAEARMCTKIIEQHPDTLLKEGPEYIGRLYAAAINAAIHNPKELSFPLDRMRFVIVKKAMEFEESVKKEEASCSYYEGKGLQNVSENFMTGYADQAFEHAIKLMVGGESCIAIGSVLAVGRRRLVLYVGRRVHSNLHRNDLIDEHFLQSLNQSHSA